MAHHPKHHAEDRMVKANIGPPREVVKDFQLLFNETYQNTLTRDRKDGAVPTKYTVKQATGGAESSCGEEGRLSSARFRKRSGTCFTVFGTF